MYMIKDKIGLANKNAVVTGGTGYLGQAICSALDELGANVYAISRGISKSFLNEKECKDVCIVDTDVSTKEGVDKLIKSIDAPIDILVNCAYEWPSQVNYELTDWSDMEKTLISGAVSPIYLMKRAIETMLSAKKEGSIINVCSMYASVAPDHRIYRDSGRGNAIAYGASKSALMQATRYVASLYGKHGIRCNSISPGPFPKPGTFDNGFEWFRDELSNKTMLGRVGSPDELKGVIAFLASDLSSYVTGIDIPIDGGWMSW